MLKHFQKESKEWKSSKWLIENKLVLIYKEPNKLITEYPKLLNPLIKFISL